jgi:hypothetical protein
MSAILITVCVRRRVYKTDLLLSQLLQLISLVKHIHSRIMTLRLVSKPHQIRRELIHE